MKMQVLMMTIGLLILSLVAQPVWWFGLIYEWWTADRRIKRERRAFGSAVYSDKFEVRHFCIIKSFLGASNVSRFICCWDDGAYWLVGLLLSFCTNCNYFWPGFTTSNHHFCGNRGIV